VWFIFTETHTYTAICHWHCHRPVLGPVGNAVKEMYACTTMCDGHCHRPLVDPAWYELGVVHTYTSVYVIAVQDLCIHVCYFEARHMHTHSICHCAARHIHTHMLHMHTQHMHTHMSLWHATHALSRYKAHVYIYLIVKQNTCIHISYRNATHTHTQPYVIVTQDTCIHISCCDARESGVQIIYTYMHTFVHKYIHTCMHASSPATVCTKMRLLPSDIVSYIPTWHDDAHFLWKKVRVIIFLTSWLDFRHRNLPMDMTWWRTLCKKESACHHIFHIISSLQTSSLAYRHDMMTHTFCEEECASLSFWVRIIIFLTRCAWIVCVCVCVRVCQRETYVHTHTYTHEYSCRIFTLQKGQKQFFK